LGYRPEAFSDWLIQGKWPFLLESLVEKEPLGTGGALAFAVHENDLKAPFAVLNGDTYVEVDFQEMSACFQDSKLPAMLGLSFVENCERYGAVEFNEDLAVNFNEKDDSAGAGWINNGCYLLNPSLFESRKGKFSLERDLFPSLCKKGMLGVFCCKGAFRDVGIPEDFERFRNIDLPAILARQQTVRTKPS
jgi:D-glycero-alpha-D-manno-heptose 1-phosphate guanylyltransferase